MSSAALDDQRDSASRSVVPRSNDAFVWDSGIFIRVSSGSRTSNAGYLLGRLPARCRHYVSGMQHASPSDADSLHPPSRSVSTSVTLPVLS